MKAIYRPRGKAGEYASLACNLYSGCSHGCLYCYAPDTVYRDREEFHREAAVRPRDGVLRQLEKDVAAWRGEQEPVFLSFTSDPYQPADRKLRLTRTAIKILHAGGFPVVLLSKAGWAMERDFDLLGPGDWVGATLTFPDGARSCWWEPNAASPEERMAVLEEAKARGLATWVSLEPVIDPEATLEIIDRTPFVDHYKVGPLDYRPEAEEVDWRSFALAVEEKLEASGKSFYLKKALRRWLV